MEAPTPPVEMAVRKALLLLGETMVVQRWSVLVQAADTDADTAVLAILPCTAVAVAAEGGEPNRQGIQDWP